MHQEQFEKLRQDANRYFNTVSLSNDGAFAFWFVTECRLIVRQSLDPRRDLLKLLDRAERTMLECSQFTRKLRA